MNGLLELKDFVGSVKDVSLANRTVTGYLANFGSLDNDNDIIEKGAFQKSINERFNSLRFLNNHDFKQVHNKFDVLKEDEIGLYFEAKLIKGVSYSDDVMLLYDAGVINEHSIGFQTINKNFDTKTGIRTIKEVKLYEGSNVTLGANPNTPFTGFKNLDIKQVNDQVSNIVKFLKNGTATDDTMIQLEIALKQLQLHSYELGKLALKNEEPDNSTPETIEPQTIDIIKSFTKNLTVQQKWN